MGFLDADASAISRLLCQVSEDPEDLVEGFFERREEVAWAPTEEAPAARVWREEGFSVRLVSDAGGWMVSRDGLDGGELIQAVRGTARRMAHGLRPPPKLRSAPWPGWDEEALRAFPAQVEGGIRRRHLAFPLSLAVRRHRRWLQVVGRELVCDPEAECFFSVQARLPGGSWGGLSPFIDAPDADRVAASLCDLFRARQAPPPPPGRGDLLLGGSAAAVLLHEAVAHALEVDVLAQSGDPEAAVGYRLGSQVLDVLDDPAAGPPGLRRRTDDEGVQVLRRWLLRRGLVEQPLADRCGARRSTVLSPGAGRRQSRHSAPGPRSLHLELLEGDKGPAQLASEVDDGLFAAEASRGWLDPLSGCFELRFPHGRRLRHGRLSERVGSFCLRGRLGEILGRAGAVGNDAVLAGAGWCAKGGQRLPVWSTSPSLLLVGVEVSP